MRRDDIEVRLLATEIALDALLAEIEELQGRLEEHARVCPRQIPLSRRRPTPRHGRRPGAL